ncbi:MAG: hypothetical protein ACRDGM_14040 [bacterium]
MSGPLGISSFDSCLAFVAAAGILVAQPAFAEEPAFSRVSLPEVASSKLTCVTRRVGAAREGSITLLVPFTEIEQFKQAKYLRGDCAGRPDRVIKQRDFFCSVQANSPLHAQLTQFYNLAPERLCLTMRTSAALVESVK